MIKNIYAPFALVVAFSFGGSSCTSCINGQKNSIVTIEYVTSGALEEEKKVFIRAFQAAYEGIPLAVLNVESIEAFLEAAFEDEPLDLNNPNKNVSCAVAKKGEAIVGVIFFEPGLQENEVYIRQLAVEPAEQKQGIGQQLMMSIQTALPKTERLVVATRAVNVPARNFYKKIGFTECKEVPHGLNPERYVGYEKDLAQ